MSDPVVLKAKVTRQISPNGVPYEVIEPPNRLAAKAGAFRAARAAAGVELAAEIAQIAQGYPDSVRRDVDRLGELWAELQLAPDAEKQRAFYAIIHDFKGQAETFGYELVASIAASLGMLLDADAMARPKTHAAIAAHVDALAAVLKLGLTGNGGAPGRQVIEALRTAVLVSLRKANLGVTAANA